MRERNGMVLIIGTVLTVGLLAAGAIANAGELDGAKLYKEKTCFSCHGPDAKTPLMPMYPKLAGQNYEYLVAQIKNIKSGVRTGGQTAAMVGIVQIVSDPEIEAIAHYISKLKP